MKFLQLALLIGLFCGAAAAQELGERKYFEMKKYSMRVPDGWEVIYWPDGDGFKVHSAAPELHGVNLNVDHQTGDLRAIIDKLMASGKKTQLDFKVLDEEPFATQIRPDGKKGINRVFQKLPDKMSANDLHCRYG